MDATVDILHHRGPDDRGVHCAENIGLAFTRLALLDLNPRSSQPFWDESRRYCMVYNGEVYNFRLLRQRLERLGVVFRTTSDTEVVLQCLLHLPTDEALRSLEGMFALALWDAQEKRLTLARDRLGIKPLFVADVGSQLMFASEVHAFAPWIELEEDLRTVTSFLYGSGGPTRGRTFFKNVRYLAPGSVLTVDTTGFCDERQFHRVSDYWNKDRHEELASLPDPAVVDLVEESLLRSVEMQRIADAPVGALCSGGIDSSLVLAMAARSGSDLTIFHADVVGRHSEYEAAETVATHLDLDLRVARVVDEDFLDLLPQLTAHHGFPFHLNPSSVPFFLVSQVVRETGVKAVLTGEGADEVFLGYPWVVPGRTQRRANKPAAQPHTTFVGVAEPMQARRSNRTGRRHQIDVLTDMLGGFETFQEHNDNLIASADAPDETARNSVVRSLDLMNANLRALLHRNDTMGMASSIESRFPYLDSDLVSLGVNLGARAKIRQGLYLTDRRHPFHVDKWALRKVAERYLPKALCHRPKQYFATTAYQRMLVRNELFDGSYVSELLGLSAPQMEYLLDQADARLTSKLVHLDVWGEMLIRGTDVGKVVGRLRDHISFKTASPRRSTRLSGPLRARM